MSLHNPFTDRFRCRGPVLVLVLCLANLLGPWLLSVPAHGQTVPTPTPTATPTPTLATSPVPVPSAKSELSAARKRLRQAGSAHFVIAGALTETATGKKPVTLTLSGHVDISLRQHHLHTVEITTGSLAGATGSGPASERQESIGVGRWMADRTNTAPWSCTRAKKLSPSTYDPASIMGHLKQPFTIAASTVNGVPVWHIQAKYDDPSSSETGHAAYDIAQSHDTLVQGSVTVKVGIQGVGAIRITLSLAVSRLGERVKARVPASCHAGTVSATIPPIL